MLTICYILIMPIIHTWRPLTILNLCNAGNLMMDFKDIIQNCHQRHKRPLKQRKGMASHCLYNMNYTHQFTVYCAHRYPVMLSDLERSHILFVPVGQTPKHDKDHRNSNRKQRINMPPGISNHGLRHWKAAWGILIYTGIHSELNGAKWHDLEFTYQSLCAEPEAVTACIEALCNAVDNPLLTVSRSGGLRFSCRVQDYLHPDTNEAISYIHGGTPTRDDPNHQDVFLEILGENGQSSWDARYEILMGDLLHPPFIEKEVLFAHVDTLRELIRVPISNSEQQPKANTKSFTEVLPAFNSHNLELAKDALVKHGFSYIKEEEGFYKWTKFNSASSNIHISLWECDSTVWMWALVSEDNQALLEDAGLPTQATQITDVWQDTGIPPSKPTGVLPVSEKVIAVREGRLSPLSIKRSLPILHDEHEHTTKTYQTHQKNMEFIRQVIDSTSQITDLITEMSTDIYAIIESYVLDGGKICLNVPTIKIAEKIAQRFKKLNLPESNIWKPRMYRWEEAKDIPDDVRMANPFQAGNICEDPERCNALVSKGGEPRVSICPQCPVFKECQQRGYLSQYDSLKHATAQIVSIHSLFFNPLYAEFLDEIIGEGDSTDRLCILHGRQLYNTPIECAITRQCIEEWHEQWQGYTLGNFARALLNILEIKDVTRHSIVKRIRTTVNLFQQKEKELIQQMCQVNVAGKVIERSIADSDSGEELARYTILFEGGASAYIPLNDPAAKKLTANGLPSYDLKYFLLNEDVKIPMHMSKAIDLGVLDTSTMEMIQTFPTVYADENWTLWHQLQNFFTHYKRDADAPIGVSDDRLHFWIPPVLHPNVKRLLMTTTGLAQRFYQNIFPKEKSEIVQVKPVQWKTGNQVFQIQTGNYPLHSLVDYDENWNKSWLSKSGMRFLLGIHEEIDRNPNIKHAIITNNILAKWMSVYAKKENVTCVAKFKELEGFEADIQEAQVVWVISTPYWAPGVLWLRSQMIFGNEEQPINYNVDPETYMFKDKRVQTVSNQHIIDLLSKVIGFARLHDHSGKKIVLITSVELPDITDRPETILFDWEDFEIAGGLDKLPEVVATRKRFEKESQTITATHSRQEVERILGCSTRQANRVLQRLRGGAPLRVPLKEQIIFAISDGAKRTSELIERVEGHPVSIQQELRRLVDKNEVVKKRRGIYALPDSK